MTEAAATEASRTMMMMIKHLRNRRVDNRRRRYSWTKRERPLGIRGRLTLTARLTDYSAPGSIGPAKRLKVILSSERLLGPISVLLALLGPSLSHWRYNLCPCSSSGALSIGSVLCVYTLCISTVCVPVRRFAYDLVSHKRERIFVYVGNWCWW